jgi:hypothetical protein
MLLELVNGVEERRLGVNQSYDPVVYKRATVSYFDFFHDRTWSA